MAQLLSENKIAEFRDCFNLYDSEHRGRVPCEDLIKVMRSLGACPTPGEVAKHLQSIKKKPSDYLDFSQFLGLMQKQIASENPKDEITKALRVTEKSRTDTVSVAELRHILMHTGEKLTAKEVDQMFRAANVRGNRVKISEFVAMVSLPIPDY